MLSPLGDTTYDVYLNERAYWRNVPAECVELPAGRLPGPQKVAVVPGERVLGRALTVEEVQAFAETARRVAAVLGMGNAAA